MQKPQFIAAVAKLSQVRKADVAAVLSAMEEVAAAQIRAEGYFRLPGLVQIKRIYRGERLVRNPKSHEEFLMGASITVKARPEVSFADRVKSENPARAEGA
ncbi:HU family DNA-binding protein [Paraburkholderia sp. MM6662-R1]|uniref:HU family DNA-binding protein n=1 Tax=Paraburkholderia sp. MM6662-R1 TaxID=2991066 RepID=UPI003D1B3F5E